MGVIKLSGRSDYIHFGQIHFSIGTNTFVILEKYIQQFTEIHTTICANMLQIQWLVGDGSNKAAGEI